MHGVAIEKKHRVSLIRAAWALTKRRPEIVMWLRSSKTGSERVFAHNDNLASYAMGHLKATIVAPRFPDYDEARLRAMLAGQPPHHMLVDDGLPRWAREVELFLADRDGDTEEAAHLKAQTKPSRRKGPHLAAQQ
jgi:hypothetical protein